MFDLSGMLQADLWYKRRGNRRHSNHFPKLKLEPAMAAQPKTAHEIKNRTMKTRNEIFYCVIRGQMENIFNP